MKIMRRDSWRTALGAVEAGATMFYGIARFPRRPSGAANLKNRRQLMQWTTPTAVDFRLGFEITMYVSAR
jgi:coenzyme PQQ precursor peptide PqqA